MNRRLFVLASLCLAACRASAAPEQTQAAAINVDGVRPIIRALESQSTVELYFNPKEISIDKSIPWQKHKNTEGDAPTLEFTAAEPRTMRVELLCDLFEEKADVRPSCVRPLEGLAAVDEKLGRPPMVEFSWGTTVFTGVISRLNVKYTMFTPEGMPVRAVVSLRMKEAQRVEPSHPRSDCRGDAGCTRR